MTGGDASRLVEEREDKMVVRTIRSNEQECDQIADGKLSFIIRSDRDHFQVNDIFNFLCYKNGKPVPHRNNKFGYIITVIKDHYNAPVEKGYQLIGFRRI